MSSKCLFLLVSCPTVKTFFVLIYAIQQAFCIILLQFLFFVFLFQFLLLRLSAPFKERQSMGITLTSLVSQKKGRHSLPPNGKASVLNTSPGLFHQRLMNVCIYQCTSHLQPYPVGRLLILNVQHSFKNNHGPLLKFVFLIVFVSFCSIRWTSSSFQRLKRNFWVFYL